MKSVYEMRQRWAPSFVAVFAGTLLLVGCGDGLGGWLISDQQEVEIGEEVDRQIRAEYRILSPNDPVSIWADQLVSNLVRGSEGFRRPEDFGGYKVAVIYDDDFVNAFAGPGGFVYITTGLILMADRCAEPAAVMSHELAHVTERHSVKNIEQQYGWTTLAQWILGDGLAADGVAIMSQFLLSTTYSRDKEFEADEVGMQIAFHAGYNPYGMVDFFEKLEAMSGGASMPTFLSSHPPTSERIAEVDRKIQAFFPGQVVREQTQTYNCIGTQMQLGEVQERIRAGQLN